MTAPKIFLDSNILVYLMDNDEAKKKRVISFLSPSFIISTQVVAENVNVCIKKLKLSKQKAFEHGKELMDSFPVKTILTSTINNAFMISEKYGYSYFDSLIISTALENDCNILYTEDLTEGQLIEHKLKVVNPLKSA